MPKAGGGVLAGGICRRAYDYACTFLVGFVCLTSDFVSTLVGSGKFGGGKCILSALVCC